MADTIAFDLVSPEQLVLSRDVEMVVLPGEEGDLGVLPHRAPMIATLRPGLIHVFSGQTVQDRIFVAGGFLEITAERCTVLAEEAVPFSELSVDAARTEIQQQREALEAGKGDPAALLAAEAKLSAVEKPGYAA